jgi:hypothetical protein
MSSPESSLSSSSFGDRSAINQRANIDTFNAQATTTSESASSPSPTLPHVISSPYIMLTDTLPSPSRVVVPTKDADTDDATCAKVIPRSKAPKASEIPVPPTHKPPITPSPKRLNNSPVLRAPANPRLSTTKPISQKPPPSVFMEATSNRVPKIPTYLKSSAGRNAPGATPPLPRSQPPPTPK